MELVIICEGMVSFPFDANPANPLAAEAVQDIDAPMVDEEMITG